VRAGGEGGEGAGTKCEFYRLDNNQSERLMPILEIDLWIFPPASRPRDDAERCKCYALLPWCNLPCFCPVTLIITLRMSMQPAPLALFLWSDLRYKTNDMQSALMCCVFQMEVHDDGCV
jgi:hypothetical protein